MTGVFAHPRLRRQIGRPLCQTLESGHDSPSSAPAAGLVIYAIVFVGLRQCYGKQDFLTADGYYPGLHLLWLNIRRGITWEQLLATLGIVPILAVLTYGRWPKALRIFFWVIVPIWVGVHFVAALVAETRLMLVPQALVFTRGALFGIAAEPKRPSSSCCPDSFPSA